MKHFEYPIHSFDWDKEACIFTANESRLYIPGFQQPFPNSRRRFIIRNERTKGFRRFTLVYEDAEFYHFISEDNIKCKITKMIKNTLDEQYHNLLRRILREGAEKHDRTGTGTISVFGHQIRHKMSDGFPAITTKKLYWKGVVAELLWFLQGRTDLRYLLENDCHIWTGDAYRVYDKDFDREHPPFSAPYPKRLTQKEFEKKIMEDDEFNKWYGDLGPIYGKQWRSWGTGETVTVGHNGQHTLLGEKVIDQIEKLINGLKTNPDSRRLMVNSWNVSELDQMVLPPCHYSFQVYTRELSLEERATIWNNTHNPVGNIYTHNQYDENDIPTRAISLMWNQRSVDTPLGLPFNIASYALLLEIIAKAVNMVPDELIGNLGDCHIYKNQIEGVNTQLSRDSYALPKLHINTEFWPTESGECGIGELSPDINNLINNMQISDFQLENYKSHPAIKIPLSN